MADTFFIRWPSLGRQVRCETIAHNQQLFEWWLEQLPIRSVQSHPVVSGWVLSATAVRTKTPWKCDPATVVKEDMSLAPDGRIRIKSDPVDGVTQVFIKYGRRTEHGPDITFANVCVEDVPILREVGAAQWQAIMRTKQVIVVEFLRLAE